MLDPEWVKLILEAKKLGVTKEEVWDFLKKEFANERAQKTG
ncbi:anti-repressor SinI family protein [Bacillus sp. Bva_UNVM-123]